MYNGGVAGVNFGEHSIVQVPLPIIPGKKMVTRTVLIVNTAHNVAGGTLLRTALLVLFVLGIDNACIVVYNLIHAKGDDTLA